MQHFYWVGEYHYLTPFYSPCISVACGPEEAMFGRFLPGWWFLPFAAATLPFLLILILACGYLSYASLPSGRTPPDGRSRSRPFGRLLDRSSFYAAVIISLIHTIDAVLAFRGADGGLGVGLGTLIILANVVLLWAYAAVCRPSSARPPSRTTQLRLSWVTLGSLALTDFYVMALAAGWFSDLRIVN